MNPPAGGPLLGFGAMNAQAGQPQVENLIELSDEEDNASIDIFDDDLEDEEYVQWQDPNAGVVHRDPLRPFVPGARGASLQANNGQEPRGFAPPLERHDSVHDPGEEIPFDQKAECLTQVYGIFPDICPLHLEKLCRQYVGQADRILAAICEDLEKGKTYPKKEKVQGMKRKREITASEEAQKTYGAADRQDGVGLGYSSVMRAALSGEFRLTPQNFIDKVVKTPATKYMFQAYRYLEEAERTYAETDPKPYKLLKKARDISAFYNVHVIDNTILAMERNPYQAEELRAVRELVAARQVRQEEDDRRAALKLAEEEERLNSMAAERDGTMKECGCCFDNIPLNRMVHCNSAGDLHWFCRTCAKQTAEHVIGSKKYEITCMSMDGCDANFSRGQLQEFLEESSLVALDRNEQEAVLRMAGIENLETCPFCPYAAECPPVEVDKEFRCEAEDCKKVSCRLCRLETHIPKSCAESARENAPSIRRQIEEAMSEALIRRCNKCRTPFIKEAGCNKMTCMSTGCKNIQCYVCSKSCAYDHFDDSNRGGKPGNCKLFDNVEDRHEEEVKRAEDEAIKKVLEENPEYTEEQLRVHMSDNVKKDDEQRRARNPHAHMMAGPPGGYAWFAAHPGRPDQRGPAAMEEIQRAREVRLGRLRPRQEGLDIDERDAVDMMADFMGEDEVNQARARLEVFRAARDERRRQREQLDADAMAGILAERYRAHPENRDQDFARYRDIDAEMMAQILRRPLPMQPVQPMHPMPAFPGPMPAGPAGPRLPGEMALFYERIHAIPGYNADVLPGGDVIGGVAGIGRIGGNPANPQPAAQQPAAQQPAAQQPAGQQPAFRQIIERLQSFPEFPVRHAAARQPPVAQSPVRHAAARQPPVAQSPVRHAAARQPPVAQSPVRHAAAHQHQVRQSPVRPAHGSPGRQPLARPQWRVPGGAPIATPVPERGRIHRMAAELTNRVVALNAPNRRTAAPVESAAPAAPAPAAHQPRRTHRGVFKFGKNST